jgi:2-C-methyl-D-erythritol 2,4-cyclodiphosphate synthase
MAGLVAGTGGGLLNLRIGQGVDVHPLVTGKKLVLGGVHIAYGLGLEGDSDGDVLCHAVADGLLGAAHLGDLGHWFHSSDPTVAGAYSWDLLARVMAMVEDAGYRVINVDSTVIAESPRIAPYRLQIEQSLAKALHIDTTSVSVKATTTDGLGFLGQGQGMAALATVLLEKIQD